MAIPQLDFLLEGMHSRGQLRVKAADLQQLLLFRRALTPEELSRLGGWTASAEGGIVPQRLPVSCMVWSDHGEGRTIRSDLLGSRPVVCLRVPLDLALVLARIRTPHLLCGSAIYLLWSAIKAGRLGVVQQLLASAPALLDDEFDQSSLREPGTYDCEPLYIACSADGLPLDTRLEMVQTLVSAYRVRATQQGVEGPIFYVINRAWRPSAEYRALQAARERGCDDIVSFLIESGVPCDSSAHTDPEERRVIDFILTPHRFSMDTLNLNSGGNVITPERIEQARQLFGRNNTMAFGYLVGKLNLEDCAPPGGWGSLDPDEVKSRALRDAIESEAKLRDLHSKMLFAEAERLRGDLLAEQLAYSTRTQEPAAADPKLLCFVCNPDATDEALPQALNDALAASHAIPATIIGGTVFAVGRKTAQEAQTADRDCTLERLEAELRDRSESRRKPSYFLFSGHANVLSEGREKRLGFTTPNGSFAPADNDRVAALLGEHAFSGDGGIRLVVLNGCESLDLARACRAQGVPAVVCWETVVPDEAAYLFVRGFFRKLAESQDFERAFDAGKEAIVSKTRTVRVRSASGEAVSRRAVPFFEFADPNRVQLLPSGSFAAGVPLLLTAKGERR